MKKFFVLFSIFCSCSNNDVAFYLQEAHKSYEVFDYPNAIYYYSKAIEEEPDNNNAYVMRGLSKFKSGDKNGACTDWSQAGQLGSQEAYTLIQENCQ